MTDLTELAEGLPTHKKGPSYAVENTYHLIPESEYSALVGYVFAHWTTTTDPVWAQIQLDLLELDIRFGRHLNGNKEDNIEYSPD